MTGLSKRDAKALLNYMVKLEEMANTEAYGNRAYNESVGEATRKLVAISSGAQKRLGA